jgi:hypothetical protein
MWAVAGLGGIISFNLYKISGISASLWRDGRWDWWEILSHLQIYIYSKGPTFEHSLIKLFEARIPILSKK